MLIRHVIDSHSNNFDNEEESNIDNEDGEDAGGTTGANVNKSKRIPQYVSADE